MQNFPDDIVWLEIVKFGKLVSVFAWKCNIKISRFMVYLFSVFLGEKVILGKKRCHLKSNTFLEPF